MSDGEIISENKRHSRVHYDSKFRMLLHNQQMLGKWEIIFMFLVKTTVIVIRK
jgi:hypothetical protein